mmetsp:Transcript_12214/g.18313  ORF Transcript_12214/g.18313 Transcript_12214/m.18313 type:complete len:268 (-) Transcript_12214:935-1738(-)
MVTENEIITNDSEVYFTHLADLCIDETNIKKSADNTDNFDKFVESVRDCLLESEKYRAYFKDCSIQFFLPSLSPCCCIELSFPSNLTQRPKPRDVGDYVVSIVKDWQLVAVSQLRVEYCEGYWRRENPELIALHENHTSIWALMGDRLQSILSTALALLDSVCEQLRERATCFVMFGPKYDFDKTCQWMESEVAVWVCISSPWARRFLPHSDYLRPTMEEGITIHYWSLVYQSQVKLNCRNDKVGELYIKARDWTPSSVYSRSAICG